MAVRVESKMQNAQSRLRDAYRLAYLNSDDPSTKNGAILLNRFGQIIGSGVNCFPRDVLLHADRLQRPTKYAFMEHAERNAIFAAARQGESTDGGTLYCPWYACSDCARAIIQAGIVRVIGHKQMFDRTPEHWKESIAFGNEMFREAGVEALQYDGLIGECTGLINGETWNP